ncbi:MAG: exodeoxyribonuclease I [Thiotrichaceae bacterium]|nr:exodeoxyribonuclease I [Thiotrichaceae bacterium]
MTMILSFLWHDYETWGVDPRRDRVAQFAAIRTDENLQEIGEPINLFCKPSADFLPHPDAALITKITPQQAEKKGIIEAEFFTQIYDQFMVPKTCGVGYNNLRFDDEVTRSGFYRNFLDPYAREWQGGNSRWDIVDLVRMTFALRPEGIQWPIGENGLPSFRLELLTKANNIIHEGAHDALSDVRATIALARLIKEKQPKLFSYYLNFRNKMTALSFLDLRDKKSCLHVSGMYSVEQGGIAPIMPLLQHPTNKNEIIVIDLRESPEYFLSLSAEQMRENLYSKTADLGEGVTRIGLKGVQINKSPALAPFSTLSAEKAEQWQINLKSVEQHRQMILADITLNERLTELYRQAREFDEMDVDAAVYQGFIPDADRALCHRLHKQRPEQRVEMPPHFADQRLEKLYPRYIGRNWPHLLNDSQLRQWHDFCKARLIDGNFGSTLTLKHYQQRLQELSTEELSEKDQAIVVALIHWPEMLF